ncbi:MAG TPA: nucleotidyltransferase family protein [Candidatus Acidoferrales bacterium]|nr:nucleotidyltransferase family protein [Candidatus Acidoferrales bacterium]
MKTIAAIILAAGESRRMGRPKALLACQGTTFLGNLLRSTAHTAIGIRRVVLGAAADEIQHAAGLPPEIVVINKDWPKGQLSSIHAGLRSLPEGKTDGVLIFPVDHPLISPQLVDQMIKAFRAKSPQVMMPAYEGHRGHPVLFAASVYAELLAAPEDVGARAVVWAHQKDLLELPTKEEGVVTNLNDPEGLANAAGQLS